MTNAKTILFFADKLPPMIGGMEVHAHYFIEHFSKHSVFPLIDIVTKNAEGNDFLVFKKTKINLETLPYLFNPSFIFFNSGRWVEKLNTLNNLFPNTKFIYRTGGNEILQAPLEETYIYDHQQRQRYWANNLNTTIDVMITNSTYTEKRLNSIGINIPYVKCVGGVNTQALQNKSYTKISNPTLRLFCAARFVPYKNHKLLISVVNQLIDRGYDIKLRLAGDGPLLQNIKDLVKLHHLDPYITFLGAVSNDIICSEIIDAHAYIQFSTDFVTVVEGGKYIHSEGMGRSILEALSAGTYVIAGKCGALSEIVTEDKGILIDLDNVTEISNTLEKIINKIPTNLPKIYDYSWKNVFQKYEKLLMDLIN